MASALEAAAYRYPNSLVIALTGNLHASKQEFPGMGTYPLMAMLTPTAATHSLVVTDMGGEAWNDMGSGCRPNRVGSTSGMRRGVFLSKGEGPLAGYDGRLRPASPRPPRLPRSPTHRPRPPARTSEQPARRVVLIVVQCG